MPPLSIIADLGAGGLLLAYGIACALFERATSGAGQIVDAAMLDGTVLFMGPWLEAQQAGTWNGAWHEQPRLGAPYYDSYRCADGEYVMIGALEPQFYAQLLEGLDLDAAVDPGSQRSSELAALRRAVRRTLRTRTRDEWADHFAGVDACVAAPIGAGRGSPPSADRRRRDDRLRRRRGPSCAGCRLDRTPGAIAGRVSQPGADTDEVLADLGYDEQTVASLRARRVSLPERTAVLSAR